MKKRRVPKPAQTSTRSVPFDFLLEYLKNPIVKPLFGHMGVYVGEKLVLFLISKSASPDRGVCLATAAEFIPSLEREFPSLRPLQAFGSQPTDWRLLPADAPDFETSVIRACELIQAHDPRIGRTSKGQKGE